ncbi:MAG: hypothetical protein L6Q38_18815, partial [Nitrospira sp.]|nr:hypothetical protein [Nitrospira sp.]
MRCAFGSDGVPCVATVVAAFFLIAAQFYVPCGAAELAWDGQSRIWRPLIGLNQEDDDTDPPVVGEFVVRGSATVNGTAAYQASDSTGSVDQQENVNATITGTTRYVVQLIGDELLSGDPLGASSATTVGGEGWLEVKIKDTTLRGAWRFVASPNFDPTESAATGV